MSCLVCASDLIANKEERLRRRNICENCEFRNGVRCSICGCFLLALAAIGTPKCPKGKH